MPFLCANAQLVAAAGHRLTGKPGRSVGQPAV